MVSSFPQKWLISGLWSLLVAELNVCWMGVRGGVHVWFAILQSLFMKIWSLGNKSKMPICRPSLYPMKSKVNLRFWWPHQSSHSRTRRSFREISKSISSQTICFPGLTPRIVLPWIPFQANWMSVLTISSLFLQFRSSQYFKSHLVSIIRNSIGKKLPIRKFKKKLMMIIFFWRDFNSEDQNQASFVDCWK
jgi:hypothetical protein